LHEPYFVRCNNGRKNAMPTRFKRLALLAAVLLGLGTFPALAQEAKPLDPELLAKIRKSNDECFACHTPAALKHPPRPGMDMAKLATLVREPEAFNASSHGNMECKQCHGQGYKDYPHAAGAAQQVSPCSECHAVKVFKIEQQWDKSVHAQKLKGKMTCNSCHDPHLMRAAAKIGEPKAIVAQDNAMCLDCHNSDLAFARLAPDSRKRPDIDALHGWLPNTKLHWQAVRCVECHTPLAKTLSHEVVAKDKAEKNCVTCHSTQTALRTRLYRHLVQAEENQFGFVNTAILKSSYVIGATRNTWVDIGIIGAIGATVGGVALHGALRIVLAILRRRNGK
jgi:predicted CXXCH cytochrome family protein